MASLENRIEVVRITKDYGKLKLGLIQCNGNLQSYLVENYFGELDKCVVVRTLSADPFKKNNDPEKKYYNNLIPSKFITKNTIDVYSDWQNKYMLVGVMFGYNDDECAVFDEIKKSYDPGEIFRYLYIKKKYKNDINPFGGMKVVEFEKGKRNPQIHSLNRSIRHHLDKCHYYYPRCVFINEDVYYDTLLMKRIEKSAKEAGLKMIIMDNLNKK